ncbi:MAG TPA: ankyrin repeat domain-containing protein [Vicinamibacteria bacterium]|nr:ankyrin repeat domain-containing protein [Vicinamibacteria bacterium]
MRAGPSASAWTIVVAFGVSVLVAASPSYSPVADAAKAGDLQSVRTILQQGADVNAAQGDGMSALHWAAVLGDAQMAEMLIYAGANVMAETRIGHYTPLHVAAKGGKAAVVETLLEAGADVNARTTNSGSTPLHLAAASGNASVVTALLARGANVDARDSEWGQTPLIHAAAQNRVEAIRALLQSDADPAITTKVLDLEAEEKLVRAAEKRQEKVLETLRGKGSTVAEGESAPTTTQLKAAIMAARELYLSGEAPGKEEPDEGRRFRPELNLETKGGLTALLHAARQGYVEASLALLDGGADVNQVSAGDGTSPLLMATINAQFDLALVLLEHGADPNLEAHGNGVTPLWAAVNAQWQPRTRFPQPQEHELQKATYLDLMKALLDAGANPDARLSKHPWYMVYTGCGNRNCGLEDTVGSTAFWRAAYATDVDAMRLLVAHGADPNIPTKAPPPRPPRSGTIAENVDSAEPKPVQPSGPALWPATDATSVTPDPSGLPKVKAGDPGVFPIHAASGVGYGEGFAGNAHRHAPDAWLAAVKYLVEELGVDVNARDYNGYNALHHAAARGDDEMILYLVEKGCDVTAVSRSGQTTADMANGPVQRVSPFPETVALLERLGSKNNHNCVSC